MTIMNARIVIKGCLARARQISQVGEQAVTIAAAPSTANLAIKLMFFNHDRGAK